MADCDFTGRRAVSAPDDAAPATGLCWLPIVKSLTPHGLRHPHQTVMEDLGTEKVLMDERMGHIDGITEVELVMSRRRRTTGRCR
ncbi:hypothetical protein SAM23877_4031 [Streptomyces ambofaciens ATCC 23877]|uniref:Uncharacterized protein n=1 Tax=Streptomyces ambofaciens (strain ATCC 23877 / 3486 / DSM 40053 / JCM 4204 / NBRC 12836 / NRRL B-2516) TaxID=278992 RepID=A0A0K2AW06_STRA7|nr:hypothetical protein SAM23877_4031 [Streptomyces ambofaciens ATCC 23877]